ncbi:MAG: hypothetical protein IJU19_00610 [Bacteroidales bacterium]|nr:hypothetical protein [Bacteroidales bacterium]
MKKELFLTIGYIPAIGLPFLINAKCVHTNYPNYVWAIYLAALFIYWVCWTACCYLEKTQPSMLSIIGTNLGLYVLIFSIVVAFINIRWWLVILFLPFLWAMGGWIGGKMAKLLPMTWLYLLIGVGMFSFLVHVYYTF